MNVADLGIPDLWPDEEFQLLSLIPPILPYGTISRTATMRGTFHFYCADTKFTRLFAKPERILGTGCVGVVEPNCSTGHGVPLVAALFGIYRKRAVAAFWQSCGIRVSVDLNVDDSVLPYALTGVPRGWRSYSVRSHRRLDPASLTERFRLAEAHAEGNRVSFFVFGGGRRVKTLCLEHGWTYVPEHMRVARGLEG